MSNVAAEPRTNEQIVLEIQTGESPAAGMQELWEKNKSFVFQIIKRYAGITDTDDLMQEGYLGLYEAAMHYAPDREATFLHYSTFWIRQKCINYLSNCGSTIRIPINAKAEALKYEKLVGQFQREFNRNPTEIELQAFLEADEKKVRAIQKIQNAVKIRSLEERLLGFDEDITLGDTIESANNSIEDAERKLDHETMSQNLWNAVNSLPKIESDVIKIRYIKQMTLKETGQQLGVNTDRAKTIETSAFRKLREPNKCKEYKRYFEQYVSAGPIHHVSVRSFQNTWLSATEREAFKYMGIDDIYSWNT